MTVCRQAHGKGRGGEGCVCNLLDDVCATLVLTLFPFFFFFLSFLFLLFLFVVLIERKENVGKRSEIGAAKKQNKNLN